MQACIYPEDHAHPVKLCSQDRVLYFLTPDRIVPVQSHSDLLSDEVWNIDQTSSAKIDSPLLSIEQENGPAHGYMYRFLPGQVGEGRA